MPAPAFRVVVISPPGYRHSAAFAEVAETLHYAIRANGYACGIDYNRFTAGAVHIVLGSNLVSEAAAPAIPAGSVIYNLEQIDAGSRWWHAGLRALVERCETWDYSQRNIETFATLGVARAVVHVPMGCVPELNRIALAPAEDVDVLFYGSVNERRLKILEALRARGLTVAQLFGVYGSERDAWIARAKVVLNLHLYPAKILEIVRLTYLLQNRKAIVAEAGADTALEPGIADAVRLAPYEGIVDACAELCADAEQRTALAEAGERWAADRSMTAILAPHLARLAAAQASPEPAPLPLRLKFGGFSVPLADCLCVDRDNPAADITLGASASALPMQTPFDTVRYGRISLLPDSFDQVDAGDWPAKVPDLEIFLRQCARLLRPGGRLDLDVPHDLSGDAWNHPGARRALSERSFAAYADAHVQLGWGDAALEVETLNVDLTDLGMKLKSGGADADMLLRTPRAVARVRVTLRRRGHRALPNS